MTELLAAIAVVASVAQLADYGFKLSIKLYNFSAAVSSADKSIAGISSDVSLTSTVLKELCQIIENDKSRVVSEGALVATAQTVKDCLVIFAELEDALDKSMAAMSAASKRRIVGEKLKWPFKEKKMELMRSNLDRLKASLTLMLQVLSYARDVSNRNSANTSLVYQQHLIEQLARSEKDMRWRHFELQHAIEYEKSQPASIANTNAFFSIASVNTAATTTSTQKEARRGINDAGIISSLFDTIMPYKSAYPPVLQIALTELSISLRLLIDIIKHHEANIRPLQHVGAAYEELTTKLIILQKHHPQFISMDYPDHAIAARKFLERVRALIPTDKHGSNAEKITVKDHDLDGCSGTLLSAPPMSLPGNPPMNLGMSPSLTRKNMQYAKHTTAVTDSARHVRPVGSEVLTRARSRYKGKYSRSRSRSQSSSSESKTPLGLAAAESAAAAAGKYVSDRRVNGNEDIRGRSRTRSASRHRRSRSNHSDDSYDRSTSRGSGSKNRKVSIAKAGAATAMVAGVVEHTRDKSRRDKQRSKSRLRTGAGIASAGLAGASVSGLYESSTAREKRSEEEDEMAITEDAEHAAHEQVRREGNIARKLAELGAKTEAPNTNHSRRRKLKLVPEVEANLIIDSHRSAYQPDHTSPIAVHQQGSKLKENAVQEAHRTVRRKGAQTELGQWGRGKEARSDPRKGRTDQFEMDQSAVTEVKAKASERNAEEKAIWEIKMKERKKAAFGNYEVAQEAAADTATAAVEQAADKKENWLKEFLRDGKSALASADHLRLPSPARSEDGLVGDMEVKLEAELEAGSQDSDSKAEKYQAPDKASIVFASSDDAGSHGHVEKRSNISGSVASLGYSPISQVGLNLPDMAAETQPESGVSPDLRASDKQNKHSEKMKQNSDQVDNQADLNWARSIGAQFGPLERSRHTLDTKIKENIKEIDEKWLAEEHQADNGVLKELLAKWTNVSL